MSDNDMLVVTFRHDKVKNEAASKAKGRPIFDDMEQCVIRAAGDRNTVKVFPAHAFSHWITGQDGDQIQQTYAERFSSQYRRFKENATQVQEGTPVSELPFLTEAKRSELRALNIFTAESLAALDGANLKALGQGGRDLKNQAQAYIDAASDSSVVVRLAAENEALKQQLAAMGVSREGLDVVEPPAPDDEDVVDFDTWADDDLKEYIAQQTGAKPRGNPSHETLVRMAGEAKVAA
jgi:hypothetical protein